MVEEKIIDTGNIDWKVKEENGDIWITPSVSWEDGEVYETMRDGQREIYNVLSRFEKE